MGGLVHSQTRQSARLIKEFERRRSAADRLIRCEGRLTANDTFHARVTNFFAGIYHVPTLALRHLLGLDRALAPNVLNLFHERFTTTFGRNDTGRSTDNYWLCYFHVMESLTHSPDKINKFLNLALFSRNISFAFLVSGLALSLCIGVPMISPPASTHFLLAALACYFLSAMMLARYYYWFTFFTKMGFRAFVSMNHQEDADASGVEGTGICRIACIAASGNATAS